MEREGWFRAGRGSEVEDRLSMRLTDTSNGTACSVKTLV